MNSQNNSSDTVSKGVVVVVFSIIGVVAIALGLFFFSLFSSSDFSLPTLGSGSGYSSQIVGKWSTGVVGTAIGANSTSYEFNRNGRFTHIRLLGTADPRGTNYMLTTTQGRWSMSGDVITLHTTSRNSRTWGGGMRESDTTTEVDG